MKLFNRGRCKASPKLYHVPMGELIPDNYKRQFLFSEFWNDPLTAMLASGIYTNLQLSVHYLIAGATGSGKSVCINTILLSLMLKNSPDTLQLHIIDPKMVDYIDFRNNAFVRSYSSDIVAAIATLKDLYHEMVTRYNIMQQFHVDNIHKLAGYPHILLIFDEYASFSQNREVQAIMQELSRLARAAGITIILATQYPTSKCIDSILKANMPTCIAFKVKSAINSRVILDHSGAEKLTGAGDGLLATAQGEEFRFQCYMFPSDLRTDILTYWSVPQRYTR